MSGGALERLAATIAARKGADPESSWTAKLLAKGPEKCAEKRAVTRAEMRAETPRWHLRTEPVHNCERWPDK